MSLRLSRALKTSPGLWLNMQKGYDLWMAEHERSDWQDIEPLPGLMKRPCHMKIHWIYSQEDNGD
jgi:plasmid maintenance system antidote protein VapI